MRAIVLRATYRGEVIYNATRKRDPWGQRKTSDRPEHEWIRTAPLRFAMSVDDGTVSLLVGHRGDVRLLSS